MNDKVDEINQFNQLLNIPYRMVGKGNRTHAVLVELHEARTKRASFALRKASGRVMRGETEIYYDQIIKSLEAELVGLAEQLADLATDLMNATQEERSRRPAKG